MSRSKVGTVDEFPEGMGRVVQVEGRPVAVFRSDDELFAIDNSCKHKGGPLGEGMLVDEVVTCPWHGWQYDVTSGRKVGDPSVGVERYEVTVEDGDVYVET